MQQVENLIYRDFLPKDRGKWGHGWPIGARNQILNRSNGNFCRLMWTVDSPDSLSLYIHFPWCVRKCPYCDFNSHLKKSEIDEAGYIDVLLKDFRSHLERINTRTISSIFLGGGTPSLFSGRGLSTLIDAISREIQFDQELEITLEANPGTTESDHFERYLEAGINRLSLGVQSFNDDQLKALGRIHDSKTARSAICDAIAAGFTNINLDLMFGLPGQTLSSAMEDCTSALQFDTTHLSFYQLTIEPNTLFAKYPPHLPDPDDMVDMQNALMALIADHGYQRYEVSAFAADDQRCRHNLNYWEFGDYLGIGAGAHSKLTTNGNIKRIWKQKHPTRYMQNVEQGVIYSEESVLNREDVLFEFLLNGLRLKQGFSVDSFERRTGLSRKVLKDALHGPWENGWITEADGNIRCSEQGYWFIDEILTQLVPE